jgi:D-3-phosphoglycerate dehydrogenase
MKILIAEPIHPILKTKLTKAGFETENKPDTDAITLRNCIHTYDGLVVRSRFKIGKEILAKAEKLKFVARAGSGIENIDHEYAHKNKIAVINSPEGNAGAVGEHALGLLLGLMHKIEKSAAEVKSGKWDRKANIGNELSGKTAGIIGYGNTGSRFAQFLKGFDISVLAYDKYKSGFSEGKIRECSLNDIFEQADILSFHVPLTDETRFMFCREFLKKFQKEIYLLNTSRGEVVNTNDLLEALEKKQVLGAGLDVLEYEKHSFENLLSDSQSPVLKKLTQMPNVIITPHVAGSSEQSVFKIAEVLADKIISKYGSS